MIFMKNDYIEKQQQPKQKMDTTVPYTGRIMQIR